MAEKLGIFVTADQHLDHLIGIARAATQAGKEVIIFLTNRGVLLTQQDGFKDLEGWGQVSLCNVNFDAFHLTAPVPLVAEKDFATQARHGMMIEDVDRYIVL